MVTAPLWFFKWFRFCSQLYFEKSGNVDIHSVRTPPVHFHPLSRNPPSPHSGGRPLYTVPWMKLTTIYFFRCHNRYWFLHRSSAKRSNRLKSLHDPQDGVGRRALGRYIQYRCMSALSCYLFRTIRLTTILIACTWLTACTSSAIQIFVWGGVKSGSKSQKSLKSSTSKSGFGHQAF